MSDNTPIEWTDHTFNPMTGCTNNCFFCYLKRFKWLEKTWGYSLDTPTFHPNRIKKHRKWKPGERVFVCDMGDLFDKQSKYEWFKKIMGHLTWYPEVTFQFLTKQPKRMYEWCKQWCRERDRKLPGHMWWGTTVIDQNMANKNIPEIMELSELGAAVIYISVEPMLGLVDVNHTHAGCVLGSCDECGHTDSNPDCIACAGMQSIGWVICGVESRGKKTPGFDPGLDAIRNLRDQCIDAGVPFFLKQAVIDGKLVKMPVLDGKQWAQFPEVN